MIRIFLFFIFICGLISCKDKQKDIYTYIVGNISNREIVDKEIVSIIEEIIKSKRFSSDSSVYCIIVEFLKGDSSFKRTALPITSYDTVVRFSDYYSQRKYSGNAYKGVCIIDGYPVAIFDKDNLGRLYYDESVLIKYPLKKFRDIELPGFYLGDYYIKLNFWFKLENGALYNLYPMDSDNLYGL